MGWRDGPHWAPTAASLLTIQKLEIVSRFSKFFADWLSRGDRAHPGRPIILTGSRPRHRGSLVSGLENDMGSPTCGEIGEP